MKQEDLQMDVGLSVIFPRDPGRRWENRSMIESRSRVVFVCDEKAPRDILPANDRDESLRSPCASIRE